MIGLEKIFSNQVKRYKKLVRAQNHSIRLGHTGYAIGIPKRTTRCWMGEELAFAAASSFLNLLKMIW
tara:strand:+ start:267 stop:467 length:201 start_codon:yes stop_codon:yes gene_type:complete